MVLDDAGGPVDHLAAVARLLVGPGEDGVTAGFGGMQVGNGIDGVFAGGGGGGAGVVLAQLAEVVGVLIELGDALGEDLAFA